MVYYEIYKRTFYPVKCLLCNIYYTCISTSSQILIAYCYFLRTRTKSFIFDVHIDNIQLRLPERNGLWQLTIFLPQLY